MTALLDQEERVEREEDRVAAEYLDAGNGQLQLLSRKERISPPEPVATAEPAEHTDDIAPIVTTEPTDPVSGDC
jgi:hypothetical protein